MCHSSTAEIATSFLYSLYSFQLTVVLSSRPDFPNMNDIATHSLASRDAVKPGVTIKDDRAILVSPSNQFQRSIPLDQSQPNADPVVGLFTKEHKGKLPSVLTGFSTESRKQMAAVGVHR